MLNIKKDALEQLRKDFQPKTRVELVRMDDPYNKTLIPGCKGTVTGVDDAGTIHVRWDCGSSLGICYGVDACKIIKE